MSSGFISRSHRAIAPFGLHRPTSLAEAASLIADGAMPHAGGIDAVSQLRQGRTTNHLVSLTAIPELNVIEVADDRLSLGAAVTHHTMETDQTIARHRPDLAEAWRTVGNVRIRRAGTIGGNLMTPDTTYDAAPILAAAGAELVFMNGDGSTSRSTVADRNPSGFLIRIELPLAGTVVFDRSLKPVVSVALGADPATGTRSAAIGCAHAGVQVAGVPEGPPEGAAQAAVQELPPPVSDAIASADYRTRMTAVLLRRLLEQQGGDS